MKDTRIILLIVLTLLISCSLVLLGCTAENRPEPQNVDLPPQNSEAYYANLRAYKKSPHQVAFGWYVVHQGLLIWKLQCKTDGCNLLDSLDIVSLWGGVSKERPPASTKR
jgi:hypothetical protein